MPTLSKASFQECKRPPVAAAIAGSLLVLVSIIWSARSFSAFFSLEGLLIVVGGVVAVAFMSFPTNDVRKALYAIRYMLREPAMTEMRLHLDMMDIMIWARLIKDKDMRKLESSLKKSVIHDGFVTYGLNMVVSQYSAEEVRAMMETAADAAYERDYAPVEILQNMASHAPAFGMVGTLVGMVAMLCSLNDNVANIGTTLAVSFLSTLYGVISARMIYMPAAARLRQDVDNRRFRNYLITEGLVMLVDNKSPMHIQDRLNSFLRPEIHNYVGAHQRQPELYPQSTVLPTGPQLKVIGA